MKKVKLLPEEAQHISLTPIWTLNSSGNPYKWWRPSETMNGHLSECACTSAGTIMPVPNDALDPSFLKYSGFDDFKLMSRSTAEVKLGLSACFEGSVRRRYGNEIKSYNYPIAVDDQGWHYIGQEHKKFDEHILDLSDEKNPSDYFGHTGKFPATLSSDLGTQGNQFWSADYLPEGQ